MVREFALVDTDHHHVWLGDPDADWPEYEYDYVALDPHPPAGLYLRTGTHTGLIGVSLLVHDSAPDLNAAEWPHSETLTLDLASTEFHTIPLGGGGEVVEVMLPKPGRYALRAAWATRPGNNEYVEDGEEQYLIDIWPAD